MKLKHAWVAGVIAAMVILAARRNSAPVAEAHRPAAVRPVAPPTNEFPLPVAEAGTAAAVEARPDSSPGPVPETTPSLRDRCAAVLNLADRDLDPWIGSPELSQLVAQAEAELPSVEFETFVRTLNLRIRALMGTSDQD